MTQTGAPFPDPGEPIGSPPPPPWQAPPPAGPWPGYQTPPPPPRKSRTWLIPLIAFIGLLGVACAGSVVFLGVKLSQDQDPEPRTPYGIAAPTTTTPSVAPSSAAPGKPVGVTGKVPAGSKASTIKIRKPEDLERVCDKWYYPKAPRYTTSVAPHPITISVRDRKDLDFRTTKSYLGLPYDTPPALKAAWEPTSPAKVQLVACVDLVTIGPKVKSCKIDKPKKTSIPMKEGRYRLRLYEVATRRKIFETRLTGENETCSIFIIIGNDRSVYTGLEDEQLTEALRKYVEQ